MRKKQKSQPHERFSHNPPGHTCGLPCCSEDMQIHARLNAPTNRNGCMPVPYRQADLENNFTFRRNQLISGRPTLTNKFFSLQDKGVRNRAELPKFHDDWGIQEERSEEDLSNAAVADAANQSAIAARENLLQYRASIETDTDGESQPYIESVEVDSNSVIRTPMRHLRPWECFHNREIHLPDLPSTPRKMVFLDYRPGESHDGAVGGEMAEQEETIEVYSSGFKRPTSSSSRPPATTTSSSSSSSPTTTHSSSSLSTQTTCTATASSSPTSRPKVTYSGAVRPIAAPGLQKPLKSVLKKPRTDHTHKDEESKDDKCPVCQNRAKLGGDSLSKDQGQLSQGQGQNREGQGQNEQSQVHGRRQHIQLPEIPAPAETGPQKSDDETTPTSQQDTEDIYEGEGHVYDVLSDVAPRLIEEKKKRSSYDTLAQSPTPPPVPPTRRNTNPKPEPGRRAITPEMTRRLIPETRSIRSRDKSEERYSTFPTRRRHHHDEDVIPHYKTYSTYPFKDEHDENTLSDYDLCKKRLKDIALSALLSKEKERKNSSASLDIYAIGDKTKLLLDDTEESLYESLNPAFLSDSCGLTKNKGGGSLSSLDSARLSLTSYSSCGCTCLSVDEMSVMLSDVGMDCDVTAGDDASEAKVEGKNVGFLADNPITLIL
ncbi:uncharacterized protein [Littorina saxatilis]|uniref:uncharacterized protein n=1 Tax=Littorina saxatilis TaxID=31220 RepID=UPI0038B5C104